MTDTERSYRFRFCLPDNPLSKDALALHYACEEIDRLKSENEYLRGALARNNKRKEH